MNRIGYSIAFIFSVVLLLYLPVLFESEELILDNNGDSALVPNYEAVNLNSKLYDMDGRLSHTVAASKMEHFDDLGYTLFEQPIYTLYLANGDPWQVSAEEAVLYENSLIKLDKNVRIINLQSDDFVKEITTQFIEINLQDKTLMSDQIVNISGAEYTVQSLGVFGDLSTQQYELKEHVQTTFNPVP